MCTVTFLPSKHALGYILTSSRDEKTSRPNAIIPQKYTIAGQTLFFPKDKLAGGTWLATSLNNFTLCLLNGAFVKHQSAPPYRMSRGLMLLDFFKYNDVHTFISTYDFTHIENFTLVIVDSNNGVNLYELRWDGSELHFDVKDAHEPHIWSSCTLYTDEAIANRKIWFEEFIYTQANWSKESIINFHKSAGDGSFENSIMMNRNNIVKTVSITCVENTEDNYTIQYLDTESTQTSALRIFKHELY